MSMSMIGASSPEKRFDLVNPAEATDILFLNRLLERRGKENKLHNSQVEAIKDFLRSYGLLSRLYPEKLPEGSEDCVKEIAETINQSDVSPDAMNPIAEKIEDLNREVEQYKILGDYDQALVNFERELLPKLEEIVEQRPQEKNLSDLINDIQAVAKRIRDIIDQMVLTGRGATTQDQHILGNFFMKSFPFLPKLIKKFEEDGLVDQEIIARIDKDLRVFNQEASSLEKPKFLV